jgi:hypothetical protein
MSAPATATGSGRRTSTSPPRPRGPAGHRLGGGQVLVGHCAFAAAVSEAGDVPYEYLAGAEAVPVWAAGRRVGDPRLGRGLHQLAQHSQKVNLAPTRRWGQRHIATGPTYR